MLCAVLRLLLLFHFAFDLEHVEYLNDLLEVVLFFQVNRVYAAFEDVPVVQVMDDLSHDSRLADSLQSVEVDLAPLRLGRSELR